MFIFYLTVWGCHLIHLNRTNLTLCRCFIKIENVFHFVKPCCQVSNCVQEYMNIYKHAFYLDKIIENKNSRTNLA